MLWLSKVICTKKKIDSMCGTHIVLQENVYNTQNGKRTCGKCRKPTPSKMVQQPRINSTIIEAIRLNRM